MFKIENPLEARLPRLRGDLEIYRGPDDGDGTPTYNVHDPVSVTYYKISWVEAEVLQQMQQGINLKGLIKNLAATTSLRLTPEDVLALVKQLQFQGLLEEYQPPAALEEKWKKLKPNWLSWLMFNYLFFKIPLVKPDKFLKDTLPYVLPFLSVQAMIIYSVIIVFGLGLVLVNWSNFISTFTYFFNVKGVVVYSLAIVATKIVHELAHAYTAKKYGLHVPTMGVAILLLWPILYTDATDAWKLHNRKQRLIISSAGIVVELVLAGICTILWSMSSPGILQSLFFVIASLNWIATLFLNLNPAMRFDGYYIASDLLGVDNLHARSFNLLRLYFYRTVAGADLPDTEHSLTKRQKRIMISLAIFTWFYRLFLYTAIALFVYYQFTKVLGIFLFLLEIGIFFIWPILYEIQYVQTIKEKIRWGWRLRIVSALTAAFLIWFIVPWPIKASSSAITVPAENHILTAPLDGIVKKLFVVRGQEVAVGDPIIDIQSQALSNQISVLEKEIAILEKKLEITQLNDKNLPFFLEIQTELIQKQAELEGNQQKQELNIIKAKVSGRVYEWDEWIREGESIELKQKLGQIASLDQINLVAYVGEAMADYINKGDTVDFWPNSLQGSYRGTVIDVSPVRVQKLMFDQLASTHGGDIPVNEDLEPVESFYAVQIHLEETEDLRFGMTGWIRFWGPWRSRAFLLIDRIFTVLLRESGV